MCENLCVCVHVCACCRLLSACWRFGLVASLWKLFKISLCLNHELFSLFKVVSWAFCVSVVFLKMTSHRPSGGGRLASHLQPAVIYLNLVFTLLWGTDCPVTSGLSITSTVFIAASPPSSSSEAGSIFQYDPLSDCLPAARGGGCWTFTTATTKSL